MSNNSTQYEISTITQNVIENAIKNFNIQNYTTNTTLGIKPGENWVSVILKIKVDGEDKNNQKTSLNFFVKVAPVEHGIRNFFSVPQMFEREVYIYDKIIPEFIKIQKENNINPIFQPFVKFYGYTLTQFNEVIVMDDMNRLGYVSYDVQKYVDYEHALMYMQTIGKFHALTLAIKDQKPNLFNEYKRNTKETIISVSSAMRKTMIDLMTEGVERLNTKGYTVEYEKYKKIMKQYPDIVLEVLCNRDAGPYIVISHGDCQLRNVLFKYGDTSTPNHPTNMCLLDWQVGFIGSPVYDLSFFIFSNTNKSLRDKYYHMLINEYYRSLSTFLRKLGSNPKKMFSFETLQDHLKKFSLFGVLIGVWVSLGRIYEVDEHPKIFTTIDENQMSNKFKEEPKDSKAYFAAVEDILLDYISYGYDI
ncbi:hypothetical protein RN001_000460 [Aquatica leii]|uniref:CHK kinase-like domain-containing protein n=1 Tax=Aquatica leii TaxID=1421715 RepID=A0AAN7SKK5_9COLE|nr:hypothetical protein RN001_000460 [Aquatica leii]